MIDCRLDVLVDGKQFVQVIDPAGVLQNRAEPT
jgi:hypothetical protein